MNQNYKFEKKNFAKKDISYISVYFDNMDFVKIDGSEIVDISLKLYDKLIADSRGCCLVAESGFVKAKLSDKTKRYDSDAFVYNSKEYKADIKGYIENRLCKEGGIKCLHIHDENNWHDTVYGNMMAKMEGEYLIITVVKSAVPMPSDSKEHNVLLHNVIKQDIRTMSLDFENCEGFTVYGSEVVDIQLVFNDTLCWAGGAYCREVESGYIRLLINDDSSHRESSLYRCDETKKFPTKKQLEKRLMGIHDICHLYITYDYPGFDSLREECIVINDIREDEELEDENDEEFEPMPAYFGGYCERQSNKNLLITFGHQAKKIRKTKELLENN